MSYYLTDKLANSGRARTGGREVVAYSHISPTNLVPGLPLVTFAFYIRNLVHISFG
jgi:hypothetical protein